jgi:hypothetical protein
VDKKEWNKMTKRTPKEIIESVKDPSREHIFIKEPGKELKEITWISTKTLALPRPFSIYSQYGKKKSVLHTHPIGPGDYWRALPTPEDLKLIIANKEMLRTGIIAQQDKKTGKAQGYTYMHLKKDADYKGLMKGMRNLRNLGNKRRDMYGGEFRDKLEYLANKIGIDIRFHPQEGYYLDEGSGNYINKKLEKEYKQAYRIERKRYEKQQHSLEEVVASVMIGFAFLFLLIKIPLSGFVVSNSISVNSKAGLFLILGLLFSLIIYFVLRISIKRKV